jgi:methionyl-tRNA synthetase
VLWYADRLEPDALRYAIGAILPEQSDTDLSDEQIIARVNEELVATWGNLVNRVLSMTDRYFEGTVPAAETLSERDEGLIATVDAALDTVAGHIERVELRAGLRAAMDAAGEVNAYLNLEAPWQAVKIDPERAGTTLWVAIQAISGIRTALYPYLPHTTGALGEMLGIGPELGSWSRPEVPGGTRLGPVAPSSSPTHSIE